MARVSGVQELLALAVIFVVCAVVSLLSVSAKNESELEREGPSEQSLHSFVTSEQGEELLKATWPKPIQKRARERPEERVSRELASFLLSDLRTVFEKSRTEIVQFSPVWSDFTEDERKKVAFWKVAELSGGCSVLLAIDVSGSGILGRRVRRLVREPLAPDWVVLPHYKTDIADNSLWDYSLEGVLMRALELEGGRF